MESGFMHQLLQQLINGLSLGSIYALIALGYTMIYGILKLILGILRQQSFICPFSRPF